jgi:hypothetical protein
MPTCKECEEYYNSKPVQDFAEAHLKIAIEDMIKDFTAGYYQGFKKEIIKKCMHHKLKGVPLNKKNKTSKDKSVKNK